jgi:hypothetical protein
MAIPDTPNLDVCWPSMTVERYAALERATKSKVVKTGDLWWRQVRPFLYRPLLPFKKYDLKKTRDSFNRFGAFQHGVEDGQPHNSYLNPIVFDQPRDYDLKKLRHGVQRHIKKALKNGVTISRIVDENEFVEFAYPCYRLFYERTKYAYDTSRTDKEGFARWAHTLFQFPETVVLGAFAGGELLSFEIACLVEDTLVLKTLVSSEKALKLAAPDVLLHTIRLSVSGQPKIRMIYDSLLSRSSNINGFYFSRGARVLALPAHLHMHSSLRWLVSKASQSAYGHLLGLGEDQLAELHTPAISD